MADPLGSHPAGRVRRDARAGRRRPLERFTPDHPARHPLHDANLGDLASDRRRDSSSPTHRPAAWRRWLLSWDGLVPTWPGLATFATLAVLGILLGLGSIDTSLLDRGEFDISGLVLDASPSIALNQ